ncbi:MAG: T9SS type A sorting domain-containing protein [Saprospiraceae bacterium]|nr:T9SS type A sorting domain-containing protein [Saprospiraceae bacterium]
MVKNLLFILLVVCSLNLSGQFTYSPSPATINIPASSGDHKLDIIINNAQDSTYEVYWKIEKSSNFNSNWITYLCDLTTCYFFNVDEIDPEKPNLMPMGNHKFEFHFIPEGVAGTTTVKLNLYQDKAMTQQIMSINIPINASSTSSSKDIQTSTVKVFPNPAVDYFQVTNGSGVKKVVLYNVLGKEVKVFNNSHNSLHDVSDLKKGLYIVRMFDDKNKLLKVVRLNKSSDGA